MNELDDFIKELEEKIKTAEEGLEIIRQNIEKNDEDKKDKKDKKKPILNRGIQPMTRMRANIEEAKDAEENPELQAIIDSFNDIGN